MTLEPVYDHDGITLYHGDCLEVMPQLLTTVDAVLADLPYGTTRNDWDRPLPNKILWHLYRQLTGPRSPIALFGTGSFSARLVVDNLEDFRYDLIWDKKAVTGHLNAKRQPLRCHENIHVFYWAQPPYDPQMVYTGRSSHGRGSRKDRTINHWGGFENTAVVDQQGWQYPRSILEFARPKSGKHPNQKPVALMDWLVRSYTEPGHLVLDNVAGSGTTLVAARAAGRRAIGIELREDYVETIIDRLESGSEGDTW